MPRPALLALALAACGAPDADPADPTPTRFAFPVDPRAAIGDVIGVDHDPATGEGLAGRAMCRNHAGDGFPACYDGHDGTDFLLIGGFDAMDAGSAVVTAAAMGQVVEVVDGNYDRCHVDLELGDVSCDGFPMVPNKVVVRHDDGVESLYYHLMKSSIVVEEGDIVTVGAPLALIGSSGRSSMPHLHFEVHLPDGTVVDPYAGPESQATSWWCEQRHTDGLPGPCL